MVKRIHWKQMIVPESQVAARLTTYNFQPGKFQITALNEGTVLIVYVDKEIANVE
jgi:hypothetical protein